MAQTISNDIAIFAAELNKAFDKLLEKHLDDDNSDLRHYAPITLVLADTYGDVFAQFYEEGVEFYPELKIVKNSEAGEQ